MSTHGISDRKPSAPLIISLVALFVALGGTSIAARRYLITSATQIKPSVLRTLRGARGPSGFPGPAGPRGEAGPAANLKNLCFGVQLALIPIAPQGADLREALETIQREAC